MKCYFCDAEIKKGTGIILSTRDGSIRAFCSSKCEKNALKLKHKPQKTKWTGKYHTEKEIRLGGKVKKEEKEHVKVTKKKTNRNR